MYKELKHGRIFAGRFEHNKDLLQSLTSFCNSNKIRGGMFSIIGAVQNAKLGYYDQNEKKYVDCAEFNTKLEIAGCTGNISLKDDEIFIHAHIVLADYEGKSFAGHLMDGTLIFAAEFCIQEFIGGILERKKDLITGLHLLE